MEKSDSLEGLLRQQLAQGGFHQALGLELVDFDPDDGAIRIRAPFQELFERGPGSGQWHGGPIAAIIDIAADFAIFAKIGRGVPTADIRIDYLRPGVNTDLEFRAKVIKAGRTLSIADVEVFADNGKLVATGRGTYVTTAPG